MSRRHVVVVVILVGLAVVLVVVSNVRDGKDQAPSQPQTPVNGRPATKAPDGQLVPVAVIVLDGRADDWADVPVHATNRSSSMATYGVRTIKIARDEVNLYVLFELSLGVQERVDRQRDKDGKYWTGAFGHLRFVVDGQQYAAWLPTGTEQKYDRTNGQVLSVKPSVSYELGRKKPDADDYDTVVERDSNDDPGYIAYAGRHIEFRFPSSDLNINPDSRVTVTFDEM